MKFKELRDLAKILKDEFEDPYFRQNNTLFRVMDEQGNFYNFIEEFEKYQKGKNK